MSDIPANNTSRIVLAKLDRIYSESTIGTFEGHMNRMANDGEKVQARLNAIIRAYEQERQRNEELERTNNEEV